MIKRLSAYYRHISPGILAAIIRGKRRERYLILLRTGRYRIQRDLTGVDDDKVAGKLRCVVDLHK